MIDIKSPLMYTYVMNTKTKPCKRRNLVAKDLRTPKYRMRVVESKKLYKRIKHLKEECYETNCY